MKMVFLVVDDVWKFTDLERLLVVGNKSKVVFTSRNKRIVKRVSAGQYEPELLSESESRELFNLWAFDAPTVPADSNMSVRNMPRQWRSCVMGFHWLSLSLGHWQRSMHYPQEWRNGLTKLHESVPLDAEHQEKLLSVLRTSLDDLDEQQREFFLLLVAYPEDYHMRVADLVDQWVALQYGTSWGESVRRRH